MDVCCKVGIQFGIGNCWLGDIDESIFRKSFLHSSPENDGMTLSGLSITFLTNPQKFFDMYRLRCLCEEGAIDESELRCSLGRSNRETYCTSARGALPSFSRFKAFFSELTE